MENSDDFVFDNQMLAQIHWLGYTIAEEVAWSGISRKHLP